MHENLVLRVKGKWEKECRATKGKRKGKARYKPELEGSPTKAQCREGHHHHHH